MADTGFSRPTLATLIDRVESDINTRLPGADSRLRRSVLSVLARILAGQAHGLYGYLDFIARQVFPDTAEAEYLDRWASIWGVARKAATKAVGVATFTGTNGTGIPSGTALRRGDGIEYVTTNSGVITGGSIAVTIEASLAGKAGNAITATGLTLLSPLSGVNATASSGQLTGGTDTELDPPLLARLLSRIQQPPHGGATFDYVSWAQEVPGVTRAWCYPMENGAGTVAVRFMMDDTYTNGIPLSGDVSAVQNYIDGLRPVTADVLVSAPTAVPCNFTIDLATDTTDIRAAVTAELADMIRRDAQPGGTLLISHIREAISIAAGETDHVLSSPSGNITYTTGQIATMGTITWV